MAESVTAPPPLPPAMVGRLRVSRKAVRAALFLLPLLGITHSLEMFEPPLDRSVAVFGCYTIVLAVLDSFQGFYISLLYCFLNQEV